MNRITAGLSLALAFGLATACAPAPWREVPLTPQGLAAVRGPALRVTLIDGTALTLHQAQLVGDTLRGYAGPSGALSPVALPVTNIRRIETPRNIVPRTTGQGHARDVGDRNPGHGWIYLAGVFVLAAIVVVASGGPAFVIHLH